MALGWEGYEGDQGRDLARCYDALDPAVLHDWLRDHLPAAPAAILDIGAGSGRDATWLAGLGYEVVAVEPSATMRDHGQKHAERGSIIWVDDNLPGIDRVMRLGQSFDLILLSAVWMHVAPADRLQAFRKLVTLLKQGGMIALTLRNGPAPRGRIMHPVTSREIAGLARSHGAMLVKDEPSSDIGGRPEVSWRHLLLRLPDDGTGALPLLRHVILNDAKSSTYKLGLLRAVCRAADGSAGVAVPDGDEAVRIPLGLVALHWLRLYLPLTRAGLPQSPQNMRGAERLGFAKVGWGGLGALAPHDLRLGTVFSGQRATYLHAALRDASATIARMPSTYLCYPGSEIPILPAVRQKAGPPAARLLVDGAYLWSFGHLTVPLHLWRALSRFDAWIEPALVAEWQSLMEGYARGQGRSLDLGAMARAMAWHDPFRATEQVRRIALGIAEIRPALLYLERQAVTA